MPPWCACLFCIDCLRNVQRFVTRVEPLFCDVFAAVVVCARSLLLWSIKSHKSTDSVLFASIFVI